MHFVRLFAAFALSLIALDGCGHGTPDHLDARSIPAPVDAIDFRPLGATQLAVLGGDEKARVLTIEDFSDGKLVRQFGVTREARTVGVGADGTILLGLATKSGGAVEAWSQDGRQLRTIAMPGAVLDLASDPHGKAWALVAQGASRIALAVPSSATEQVGKPVPLPAGSSSLSVCDGESDPSFIVAANGQHVSLVRMRDGTSVDSGSSGQWPVCSKTLGLIYMLNRVGNGTFVSILGMENLLRATQFPSLGNTIVMREAADGGLVLLGRGNDASALRIYPVSSSELRVRG